MVAQEQRDWKEAREYYQQALEIYISYQDWYEQAGTLGQLGNMAREQGEWEEAKEHYFSALTIFREANDDHRSSIVLRNLARLWQESQDAEIPNLLAPILETTPEKVQALLQDILKELSE